eukprot:scaffold30077_cov166-Isochrysis_galbana.AAC.1
MHAPVDGLTPPVPSKPKGVWRGRQGQTCRVARGAGRVLRRDVTVWRARQQISISIFRSAALATENKLLQP